MTAPVLAAHDVRKSYGKQPALRGATFDVAAGELFGLLGPNGAGKTTLLTLLAGLGSPDSGEIRLFGEPFRPGDARQKRLVGLATQDLAIYPELTARENLSFFGRLYGLRGADLRERAAEVLRDVALDDRADGKAGTFSGGMKRRLNLAVAVMHRPKLLLLDEPTTGVDPQSRNHIFERVRALNRDGLTVVYTSHYMEEVQALCPRIAVLDAGEIRACDTLVNLLRTLPQTARLRFPARPPRDLHARLTTLKGIGAIQKRGDDLELSGHDLSAALPKAVAACYAAGAEPSGLEVDRPNLERVFLHLTGRELRD